MAAIAVAKSADPFADQASPQPHYANLTQHPTPYPRALSPLPTTGSPTFDPLSQDLYSTDPFLGSPSLSSPVDLNSTAPTPAGTSIPGVLLAIPFPIPQDAKPDPKRPAYLLYAPPRAPYHRPAPQPNGKKAKEKLVKRVERGWQEEVAQGEKIHDGEVSGAGRWARTKGAAARKAAQAIRWLPDSNIEALARVPPKDKMHEVTIFIPAFVPSDVAAADLSRQLQATRSKALTRSVISGALLPVTAALDWIVPIFSFEVDAAYFASQYQGLRKASALTTAAVHLSLSPSPDLSPLVARLNVLLNARSPRHFPVVDGEGDLGAEGGKPLGEAVAELFRTAVPEAVAARHNLDDLGALAEDVERCLEKGVKEYVKTL